MKNYTKEKRLCKMKREREIDENEKIAQSKMSGEKKEFLLLSGGTDKMQAISVFEKLEQYENLIGKKFEYFNDDEYSNFFKSIHDFRRIKLARQYFKRYCQFVSARKGLKTTEHPTYRMKFKQLASKASLVDKRYITNEKFNELIDAIDKDSKTPEYDKLLFKLLYRGIRLEDLINLTIDQINFENKSINVGNLVYKIEDDEIFSLIDKCYHMERMYGKLGRYYDVIPSEKIFKQTEQISESSLANTTVNKVRFKVKQFAPDKDMIGRVNSSSLRFSGMFNYVYDKCQKEGIDLVEEVLNKHPNDSYKIDYFIGEYKGAYKKFEFFNFRDTYQILCTSLNAGVKY